MATMLPASIWTLWRYYWLVFVPPPPSNQHSMPMVQNIRQAKVALAEPFQHAAVTLDAQSGPVGNLHYAFSMFDGL